MFITAWKRTVKSKTQLFAWRMQVKSTNLLKKRTEKIEYLAQVSAKVQLKRVIEQSLMSFSIVEEAKTS